MDKPCHFWGCASNHNILKFEHMVQIIESDMARSPQSELATLNNRNPVEWWRNHAWRHHKI